MSVKQVRHGALALLAVVAAAGSQAATVQTTNFIATPDRYVGFESLPDTYGYGAQHVEDGVQVDQVNGDPDGIWTTYLTPSQPYGSPTLFEGDRSWYPTSGDNGYTRLTLSDGAEFGNVSFLVGSGFTGSTGRSFHFELLNNGVSVQSGSVTGDWTPHWLGFSGGGFDEVRLADAPIGQFQALAIDAIKVSAVPEPSASLMLAAGLAALGLGVRRRRSSQR